MRFEALREEMLEELALHARSYGHRLGRDHLRPQVLEAMSLVARHEHVPIELQPLAYCDTPLPIGHGKTTSQPFIVALMTDLANVDKHHKVLEIGTGFGYQTAVLARLGGQIFSLEIIEYFATEAARRMRASGINNSQLGVGDGNFGWHCHAPFDRIVVTAAPEIIPRPLLRQLAPGGRLVIPAGLRGAQRLFVVDKNVQGHLHSREVLPIEFSPMLRGETSTRTIRSVD